MDYQVYLHPTWRRQFKNLVVDRAIHLQLRCSFYICSLMARYQSQSVDLGLADRLLHVARSDCRHHLPKKEMGKQSHSLQSNVWIWSRGEFDDDDDCQFGRIRRGSGRIKEYYSWYFQGLFRYGTFPLPIYG